MEQLDLFPEEPKQEKPVDQDKVDKARARKAEAEEFKDKRTPKSPLIQQAEMAKIREILSKPRGGGCAGVGAGSFFGFAFDLMGGGAGVSSSLSLSS